MNLTSHDQNPSVWDAFPSTPQVIDKHKLIATLADAGMPLALQLNSALSVHASVAHIRVQLEAHCDDGPGLCEFEASLLPTLVPAALQDWPVWYIRLPDTWADDVPRLVARAELSPHLLRDEQDPWYIAQWVSIISKDHPVGWPCDARRIEVDDQAVGWTWSRGQRVGGVLVFFECAGSISVTAYPIDEALIGCLQGGDGASSRHPLFDLRLEEIQAMTRAREDGLGPICPPDVVRLPVLHLGETEERRVSEQNRQLLQDALLRLGPRVRCCLEADGALGSLDDVAQWCPDGWPREPGPWLWLTVQPDLHLRFLRDGVEGQVIYLPSEEEAPAMTLVMLTSGPHLYAAELPLDDPDLRRMVQAASDARRCRLALVNVRNGRPLALELDWPTLDFPATQAAGTTSPSLDILEAVEHPYARRQAEALAHSLGTTVDLRRCLVRAAGTLQISCPRNATGT